MIVFSSTNMIFSMLQYLNRSTQAKAVEVLHGSYEKRMETQQTLTFLKKEIKQKPGSVARLATPSIKRHIRDRCREIHARCRRCVGVLQHVGANSLSCCSCRPRWAQA
jgi:hypothetical protein